MNIGELARSAETTPETVRYYERIGLLRPPPRSAGNYRSYSREHINRLSFARRARELGFSIEQIRALLALAEQEQAAADRLLFDQLLQEIGRKLADLAALRREIEFVRQHRSEGVAIAARRIIEALAPVM